jgi:hypothetical protein
MKVIAPTIFDAATHLVSSTATETYAAWAVGTTYATGAFVDYGTQIFQSLVNSNTGNQPNTSPTFWLLIGPDNRHSMFDDQISTATVAATSLTVVLDTGLANSLALFGLAGTQVTVNVTDGPAGANVYSRTVSLDGTFIFDWYQYFFEPNVQVEEMVLTDLPPYSTARVTVTVSGPTTVQVGQLVFGNQYDLGDAEYGATVGIIDYSRKDTDDFGTTTFVERAFSKRMTARLMLDTAQVSRVQQVLARVRARPSVWVGVPDDAAYNALTVYGFFRDFSIDVAYPTKSYCSLEIEGLT